MNYLQRKKLTFMKLLDNIKTALGYPVVIKDAKEGNAVDYTIYGNTVEENLLTHPFDGSLTTANGNTTFNKNTTINGITFTDNEDGTITANGTATADVRFKLRENPEIPKYGTYFLSGCPANGGTSKYYIQLNAALETEPNTTTYVRGFWDEGKGTDVKLSDITYNKFTIFAIGIKKGITVENMVFEPKLISSKFVGDKTKNLIDVRSVNNTTAGVTYKGSDDGTVTMNGTKYGQSVVTILQKSIFLKKDTAYTLSAVYENFPLDNNFYIYLYSGDEKVSELPITLAETSVNLIENTEITSVQFRTAQNNVVFSNSKVKLQFEENTTATDYEPYGYKIPITIDNDTETKMVNVYRTSQLAEGESINYKTDGLPALPLNEGYNAISAETEVKPLSIKIKYETR